MKKKKNISNEKTILVVEDDEILRQAIRDKFQLAGFKIILAKNGAEGLEQALSAHPDLVILDILMPKMDGITMLKKLKTDPWGADVPVIVLTNISDYRQLEEALSIGVDEYMIKAEWQLKDIVARVRAILGME